VGNARGSHNEADGLVSPQSGLPWIFSQALRRSTATIDQYESTVVRPECDFGRTIEGVVGRRAGEADDGRLPYLMG
jgi:hypothetical protein